MKSTLLKTGSVELTLAVLKPHVVKATHALKGLHTDKPAKYQRLEVRTGPRFAGSIIAIHRIITDSKFLIVKSSTTNITQEQVEQFYKEHKNKFFYNRLISSMLSGECQVHILAKVNAIQDWRQLMGPTKVYHTIFTHPESIRGMFGLTDTRNATHGSDSVESAAREISVFFPDFNTAQWLLDNGESFQETSKVQSIKETSIDQS